MKVRLKSTAQGTSTLSCEKERVEFPPDFYDVQRKTKFGNFVLWNEARTATVYVADFEIEVLEGEQGDRT